MRHMFVLARAPFCPCAFRGFAPLRCFVRGIRRRGLVCLYSASREHASYSSWDRGSCASCYMHGAGPKYGDPNRVATPAPGSDDAPASHAASGQEAGGRSGCTSSPSSEQSSQGIAPGCSLGKETFLSTHTLSDVDPRDLGDSARCSSHSTPLSGAGAGPQPLYRAGMVFYPPPGACGRDGL